jgi:hypothetical protein
MRLPYSLPFGADSITYKVFQPKAVMERGALSPEHAIQGTGTSKLRLQPSQAPLQARTVMKAKKKLEICAALQNS